MDIELKAARQRRYYLKHRARLAAYGADYYHKNRSWIAAKRKAYDTAHPEKVWSETKRRWAASTKTERKVARALKVPLKEARQMLGMI